MKRVKLPKVLIPKSAPKLPIAPTNNSKPSGGCKSCGNKK